MTNTRVNKLALMCAASVVALTTGAAHAQQTAQNTESVTVTGSRIISDITLSPTPITAVSAEQLQATTPTDIPDALNKLPVFIGGRTPRTQDNGSKNNGGNVLSLRNFGTQRTLVLLDGHRVPASNQDGTVDVDTLPQMLMSRVDVVTGGASAVYGSDAVAGVVNFILDKKFEGFKYNLNAGISKYGDGASEQLGIAWGTGLFGDRGHHLVGDRAQRLGGGLLVAVFGEVDRLAYRGLVPLPGNRPEPAAAAQGVLGTPLPDRDDRNVRAGQRQPGDAGLGLHR